MQHGTSDILFSLFKMTFNLNDSVDHEFSFIVKIKKNHISSEIFKQLTFSNSFESHD